MDEHGSMDAIARDYAQAMVASGVSAPFRLLGWSMGGILALPVANELETLGHEVQFVALIDSFVRADDGDSDPMEVVATVLGNSLGRAFASLDEQEHCEFTKKVRSLDETAVLDFTTNYAREKGVLGPEVSTRLIHEHSALVRHHARLLRGYRPPAVDAPLVVWRATAVEREYPWNELSGGGANLREVRNVDHYQILQPHQLTQWAPELRELLVDSR